MNNQKISNSQISGKTSNNSTTNTINNLTTQTVNTYKKTSTMGKIMYFILSIIFIAFLIYIIQVAVKLSLTISKNSPIIVNDVIDAYIARPAFALPQVTQGMNQTFSTWIYVKDWNYKFGQYKNILWKGNPPNTSTLVGNPTISNIHCPSIWLYPLTNSLKVVTSTSVPEQVESCDIQNIPLMTWVHIVYVLNNRTVDLYVNGKLERSCALRGIPTISNDPVYITSGAPQAGFYGKIGKTQYYTKALLPNDVANSYQQGPLGTTQYQVQFFKNGRIVSVTTPNSFADSS
jgi:hypothetical protein